MEVISYLDICVHLVQLTTVFLLNLGATEWHKEHLGADVLFF